ncbi:Hormone receptor-like protein [Leptotrombidium deliense]|uniref:Hormone receptor-like protein n=1 Tax=Leptotrombidium deliense TaxID=299467 RepID=A0A443SKI2_9ACAR|nr:Hormone receptor-like protein [Leptotrombidium deliense]
MGFLLDSKTNLTALSSDTHILDETFALPSMVNMWRQCCQEAATCCKTYLQYSEEEEAREMHCPRTWDGWTCWTDNAQVSSVATKPCPSHIYWKMNEPPCKGFVSKECDSNGDWFKKDGREWSNYTNCARDDPHLRPLIALAYGIPFVMTTVYALCRWTSPARNASAGDSFDETGAIKNSQFDSCWLLPSSQAWTEWIINAPNLAILLALTTPSTNSTPVHNRNLIRASNSPLTTSSLLKSMRAASLLLPLYGLHYLIVIYRPNIEYGSLSLKSLTILVYFQYLLAFRIVLLFFPLTRWPSRNFGLNFVLLRKQ